MATSSPNTNSKVDHHKKEYLVQVSIMEARQLKGRDSSGTSDPFVKINVGNLPPQVTTTAKASNSAVWNQSFTFTNLMMNHIEIETFEILIECIDLNEFSANSLIGSFSIGLSTLYKNSNHEIFNSWAVLSHPEYDAEPQGYLLISCYIIGTNDQPPVHQINEMAYYDEEPDEYEGLADDELTPEQLLIRRNRKNTIAVLGKPNLITKGYQLIVNIVRGEDIQKMGISSCDPFVSVRCCGNVQVTPVIKNTSRPNFQSRLLFPIYFPVHQDNIVCRVWDKRIGLSDIFIANIPEFPAFNDSFRLNQLNIKGGVLPFRWFNLYGIPPEERTSDLVSLLLGGKQVIEGTQYMGRVLLSLSLSSMDKPKKGALSLNSFREPPTCKYVLWVDTYEIHGAMTAGEDVWLVVGLGPNKETSNRAKMKLEKSDGTEKKYYKGSYEWRGEKVKIKEIIAELPVDKTQIPDIIISLYTKTFLGGEKRLAYLRVPATNNLMANNKPNWYPLYSIENNIDMIVYGYILMNIHFRVQNKSENIPRLEIRRKINTSFLFSAYLYGGYDICPEYAHDEIELKVNVRIAQHIKPFLSNPKGSSPLWNEVIQDVVDLDENLEFASNVVVTVENPKKKLLGLIPFLSSRVGEVNVSALKCQTDKDPLATSERDKFEPNFQYYHILNADGEIRGRILAAFHLYKLPKKHNYKKDDNNKAITTTISRAVIEKMRKVQVDVAVLGARKLPNPLRDPNLVIRISGQNLNNEITKSSSKSKKDKPPQINIETQELKFEKCEIEDGSIRSKAGNYNPNFYELKSLIIHIPKTLKFLPTAHVELLDGKVPVFSTTIPLFEFISWERKPEKKRLMDFFENGKQYKDNVITIENGIETRQETNAYDEKSDKSRKSREDSVKKEESQKAGSSKDQEINRKKSIIESPDGVNIDITEDTDSSFHVPLLNQRIEKEIVIDVTRYDKEIERIERKERIRLVEEEIKKLPENAPLRNEKQNEREKIKNEEVREENFAVNDYLIYDEFEYGRGVTKEEYEKSLELPYRRFSLHKLDKKHSATAACLKAMIRVSLASGEEKSNSDKRSVTSKKSGKSFKSHKSSRSKYSNKDIGKEKFNFEFFDSVILKKLRSQKELKCRVYIYRCLNLTAQSSSLEYQQFLAGMDALCSTNAYPEVVVGNGKSESREVIKSLNDRHRYVKSDLYPNFFRMYELDATLPHDWNLEIRIWDYNKMLMDSLIGMVEIDLEDRLFGQEELRNYLAYEILKESKEEEILEIKYKHEKEFEDKKQQLKVEIAELDEKLERFKKDLMIPVEFQPLKKPGKNTSQGTIEMCIEPFPLSVAKKIPPSAIEPPQPQEFEIRLIIWETFNIPRTNNKSVDIFVKVIQDSSGWVENSVLKSTDTHCGSEDGHGIFNYRLKFPLVIPCPFPRLRFSVYDFETLSSDESLGESVISFRKILKKLRTEGKFEMPQRKIKLQHPNFPDEDRGDILISLAIISKQEADSNPVGEGQNEPNIDPFLEKPKEGRSTKDFFKNTFLDFSLWNLFGMRMLKILAASVVSLLTIFILFVKPGILVK